MSKQNSEKTRQKGTFHFLRLRNRRLSSTLWTGGSGKDSFQRHVSHDRYLVLPFVQNETAEHDCRSSIYSMLTRLLQSFQKMRQERNITANQNVHVKRSFRIHDERAIKKVS